LAPASWERPIPLPIGLLQAFFRAACVLFCNQSQISMGKRQNKPPNNSAFSVGELIGVLSSKIRMSRSSRSLRQMSFIAKWLLRPSRNYIKNPMLKLARSMAAAGELGEITGFRGIHAEDYMADIAGGARAGFSRSLGNSEDHRYGGSIIQIADVASDRVGTATIAAEAPGATPAMIR
jgi:hypothetical protein